MPAAATPPSHDDDREPVIPVIQEHARVTRMRQETGAVRIRIESVEDTETLALERVEQQARVERVPVGEVVGQRRDPWWHGETLVVPVYAERAVVERHWVLVEEIRLHRAAARSTTQVAVPVTRQRAVVERLTPQGDWTVVDDSSVPAQAGAND